LFLTKRVLKTIRRHFVSQGQLRRNINASCYHRPATSINAATGHVLIPSKITFEALSDSGGFTASSCQASHTIIVICYNRCAGSFNYIPEKKSHVSWAYSVAAVL